MSEQLIAYVNYLKKIMGLSDISVYHYLTYHRHFKDQPLTQKNIDRFIETKNNSSVSRAYMNSYLRFLKRDKEFDIPRGKSGRKKKKIIQNITQREMEKIINFAYAKNKRDGLIIDILYYGALRRFEINTLKVSLIDFGGWLESGGEGYCEVKVYGKGKKERVVLINPRAIKVILDFYLQRGVINLTMSKDEISEKLRSMDERLFKKLNEKTIYDIIIRNAERSIGRKVNPHQLRHARATELSKLGINTRDIQNYLGHSSQQTTEIYLHTTQKSSLSNIKNTLKNE